ncbi:magnesium-dependent phosphatase 1 [Neodiprion pinetum]|uniref:Magnesium-dependent phosphatase 1 n=1 Tax=Neodiprion lecontei TaxID=441921 RepID=A0A6J0B5M6_NEOLC|nr:magnesium-dependent phosphatase 1 [Neodiprion lecontei]XP_046470489.1 magnesium-dependent phosphatase 1-like [Neodiprion pinetum]
MSTDKRPRVIVFDLDYTLWPFWVDTHVTPPFRKGNGDQVVDALNHKIKYYPEVPEVLKELVKDGYELGVASRTGEIQGANQLLNLLGWDKYFTYKEIYPGCKVTHFSKIQKNSGVNLADMLFFDDEQRNIKDLTKMGVTSILVRNGVNKEVVQNGLRQFAQ